MIHCPAKHELLDYCAGKLAEPQRQQIEEHAKQCPLCSLEVAQATVAPQEEAIPSTKPLTARPEAIVGSAPLIPGYDLTGEVRLGGMGAVYFGTETTLRRPVAVKVLRQELAGAAGMVQRFEEEARICAQLQHPGIVPVYQVGRLDDGRPFYAMKLVKGDTLAKRLRQRPTPTDDLIPFLTHFARVCEAMAYAHAHRVLHRDLKPENVMIGAFGEVLLMDWGLAKVQDDHAGATEAEPPSRPIFPTDAQSVRSETSPGAVLGTVAYMPPEQAKGHTTDLDARSDVFGLGAILLTILTGQPPYQGPDEWAILHLAMKGDLREAEERLENCGTDAELVALARQCLAPEPKDRPAHGRAVEEAIKGYLNRVEQRRRDAEVQRQAAEVRAVEETKRRRLVAVLAVVGLAAMLLVGFFWRRFEQAAATARLRTEAQVSHELGRADSLREQARQVSVSAVEQHGLSARLWDEVLSAAQLAEAALESGPLDATTREKATTRLHELRTEAGEFARDREFVQQLEAAYAKRHEMTDEDFNRQPPRSAIVIGRSGALAYAAAFRAQGIEVLDAASEVVAAQINARQRIWVALVDALDDWMTLEMDRPVVGRLLGVASRADPDPFRNRLRAAVVEENPVALKGVAVEARTRQLPLRSWLLLANGLDLAGEIHDAIEVLRRTRREHPGDFTVNDMLGTFLMQADPSRLAEAGRCLAVALARRPRDPAVHTNLGFLLLKDERPQEAVASFQLALECDKEFSMAKIGLALVSLRQDDLAGCLAKCKEIVAVRPQFAEGLALLARCQMGMNNIGEAAATLDRLLKCGEKWSPTQRVLGDIRSLQQRHQEAISAYRQVLQKNDKDTDTYLVLAQTYLKLNDLDNTRQCLQEAYRCSPNEPEVHAGFKDYHLRKGEFSRAIASCQREAALRPLSWGTQAELGRLYRQANNLDAALFAFEEAVRLNPKWLDGWSSLSELRLRNGDWVGALQAATVLASLQLSQAGTRFALGEDEYQRNEYDAAIVHLRKAIELRPTYALAHSRLGDALMQHGKIDEAISAQQQAISNNPTLDHAHLGLARALRAKGLRKEGVEAAERAARLSPTSLANALGLAEVLVAAGRFPEGRDAYKRVISLVSDEKLKRQLTDVRLKDTEAYYELELLLPTLSRGAAKPKSLDEGLRIGGILLVKNQYVAAVRYFDAAQTLSPTDFQKSSLATFFLIARANLLAAGVQGADAPLEAERIRYRTKALEALRTYLKEHRDKLEKNHNAYRNTFQANVRLLSQHVDLTAVQRPALNRLPELERKAWQQFWDEVDVLLAKADTPRDRYYLGPKDVHEPRPLGSGSPAP